MERELTNLANNSSRSNVFIPGDWIYHQNKLLMHSKIICSTLSMSGIEKLELTMDQFDYLLIDEAC